MNLENQMLEIVRVCMYDEDDSSNNTEKQTTQDIMQIIYR